MRLGERRRDPITGEGLAEAQHTGSAHLSGPTSGSATFASLSRAPGSRSEACKHAEAEGRNVITGDIGTLGTHDASAHLSWSGTVGSAGGAASGCHSLSQRRRAQSAPRGRGDTE
eukprot:SAG31_NODE_28450_length_410_cov_0.819936_1_plen_114_part_10